MAPFFQRVVDITGQKPRTGVRIARRRFLQYLSLFLIWLTGLVALSSPQIVGEPEKKIKTARSLMIAADISASMSTRDWEIQGEKTTRWEAVKSVMDEFIQRRQGDRLGLIFFGSQAYLQVPFTTDLDMVSGMLKETEVGMAGQRTAIGNAIGRSIRLFQADSVNKKVLILLTDGVDSGSEINPVQAARTAALDSIVIYTIGIGNPGAGLFQVDERTMKQIAQETGGEYFLALNHDELDRAYKTIDRMEPIEFEDESYRPVRLLFYWPLAVGFALAILHQLIAGIMSLKRNK